MPGRIFRCLSRLAPGKNGGPESLKTVPEYRKMIPAVPPRAAEALALPAGVYTVSMYDYDTDREWLLLRDEWLEVTNLPPEQVPEPAVFEFEKEEIYALPVFAPDDPAEPADPETADAA